VLVVVDKFGNRRKRVLLGKVEKSFIIVLDVVVFYYTGVRAANTVIEQTLYYITLRTISSGPSKSNLKDHYGEAVKEQCLGNIAKIEGPLWRSS